MFSCSERVDHHFVWLYNYQPYHVLRLLQIYICEDANFIPDKVLVIEIIRFFLKTCYKEKILSLEITQCLRENISTLSCIWLDLIQGACTHSTGQPSPRSKNSSSPPMKLTPPSSASSVTIMSHSIYLAGVAYRETSLTLNCILAWKSIKVTKSPLPTPYFWHKKASHPSSTRSGPKLSDKLSGFFWLPWLDARVQAKTLRSPLSKVTQMYWSLFVPKLITLLAGSLDQRT